MSKRVAVQLKLPLATKQFIDRAVEVGLYADAGACVQALLDRRAGPLTDQELVALAEEALRDRRKSKVYSATDWQRLHDFAERVTTASAKSAQRRRSA